MKKIKILQVTGGLGVGGIEKLVTSFLEQVDLNKYSIDFLVYGNEIGEFEEKVKSFGAKIIRIPKPGMRYYSFYNNLLKVLKKYGPYDIIHSHTLFNTGLVMRAAYKSNVKIRVAHSHDNLDNIRDDFFRKIYIKIMRKWILKYSNVKCACSSLAGNYLFGKEEFKKDGIVLYNGINIQNYLFNITARNRLNKEFDFDKDIIVGTIGRIEKQKNHMFLIKVAKMLPSNYKFIIVGDGNMKEKLIAEIRKENLIDRFILTGTRNDIRDILSTMDVFVLPSIHEGLGIVLIEAQANGLPCIVPTNIVPPEAKILNSFMFVNYADDLHLNEWVTAIIESSKICREDRCLEKVRNAGYDYNDIGKNLEKIYSIVK